MQYLYHAVPSDLKDNKLYPLNTLKEKHPGLFSLESSKYKGREDVAQQAIPLLDCLWGDVIFMTAVHPQILMEAYKKAGGKINRSAQFFQIDVELLQKENIAVAIYSGEGDEKIYESYDTDHIKEYSTIPDRTVEYFTKQLQQNNLPLYYAYIPHILYKGTIDTTDLPIVEVGP